MGLAEEPNKKGFSDCKDKICGHAAFFKIGYQDERRNRCGFVMQTHEFGVKSVRMSG